MQQIKPGITMWTIKDMRSISFYGVTFFEEILGHYSLLPLSVCRYCNIKKGARRQDEASEGGGGEKSRLCNICCEAIVNPTQSCNQK